MDSKELYLNGPVNFFRLRKNDKDVYLFGDRHNDVRIQKECNELESFNFDKYLKYFFQHNTKNVDFMLETDMYQTDNYDKYNNDKNEYLVKNSKLFSDIYNKKISYKYLNVHNIDIRSKNLINEPFVIAYNIYYYLQKNNGINYDYNYLIEELLKINKLLIQQCIIIEKFKKNNNCEIDKTNILEVLFHKIMFKYNDKHNKKTINDFFDIFCYQQIKYVIKITNTFIKTLGKYDKIIETKTQEQAQLIHVNKQFEVYKQCINFKNFYNSNEYLKMINNIVKFIKILYMYCLNIGVYEMDCYCLRRLLDKSYIKNAIIYTGIGHTSNYLFFLIKYCDYEIIEFGYINGLTSEELTKLIKKSNTFMDIMKYVKNFKMNQCIKIKPLFT